MFETSQKPRVAACARLIYTIRPQEADQDSPMLAKSLMVRSSQGLRDKRKLELIRARTNHSSCDLLSGLNIFTVTMKAMTCCSLQIGFHTVKSIGLYSSQTRRYRCLRVVQCVVRQTEALPPHQAQSSEAASSLSRTLHILGQFRRSSNNMEWDL